MNKSITYKLIESHLETGKMKPGEEIGLKMDQTLTQDATGTMVMQELEAMNFTKPQTDISVQYIDHNLLQTDFKNPDDHIYLKSACDKFGIWFSPAGNGVSHPVHMQRFGKPGQTLAGSDSHTPAAGALGMLAFGAGGLDVAFAIAGKPMFIKMPKVLRVHLKGKLPEWVSAKDIVLEMLRRYDVKGCKGYIVEYYGEGLDELSAMDRHVIANMGTELGATSTVFPADKEVERYLDSQGRKEDFTKILADPDAEYDKYDEMDLSQLMPLIAKPGSPGNVVPVSEMEGEDVHQVVVGSSANPGIRDFWIVSHMLKDRNINIETSLDINPTSRQLLENLSEQGSLTDLIRSGARIHQSGCMGCIGMGQAPASGKNSLRTMPRNFPGRSGTLDDSVYLCSPETAAASAATGKITDPINFAKEENITFKNFTYPSKFKVNDKLLKAPSPEEERKKASLQKGPNIKSLPEFKELQDSYELPVLLKAKDNISTDEILKAGADVLPLRSNIPEISKWTYFVLNQNFYQKALDIDKKFSGFAVVAGENFAQGSSREHAAIAPRYLGQVLVIAKSYARIGWQNLINFGILPLEFQDESSYNDIDEDDVLILENLIENVKKNEAEVLNQSKNKKYIVKHSLSERQLEVILDGGMINNFNKNNN